MIETVVSMGLAVDEAMEIRKNHLAPKVLTGKEKRICIVTGTHGDELEGQYVCYEIIRRINENPSCLKGIVDVYPATNPLGVDCMTRGVPMFDLDLNRIFPGNEHGHMAEYAASKIIEDIAGADVCIDIHASNVFLREIPQVRINEQTVDMLLPLAKELNVDYIWIHAAATVLESTLAYSLNVRNTPTLVVEMGVGLRITEAFCHQLTDGIFHLMAQLGIWDGPHVETVKKPIVSTDGCVGFVNAESTGIFVPCVKHWGSVKKGECIGEVLEPITGTVCQRVESPMDGMVFTLREHPIVSEGSLLARILGGVENND